MRGLCTFRNKCKTILYQKGGFPGSSVGKESACNSGNPSSIPGLGRSAGEGIGYPLQYSWASLLAQLVKNLPEMWETWVQCLGWEDPWRRERLPTPVFWPGEKVSGKESDTPERRSLSVSEGGVSVGGCSAQGCRMAWRLEGAAVWAHRPRRPPAHRPAPSRSPPLGGVWRPRHSSAAFLSLGPGVRGAQISACVWSVWTAGRCPGPWEPQVESAPIQSIRDCGRPGP